MNTREQTTAQPSRRRLRGTVVSDKMQKTIVVRVERVITHPKYRKQYHVSARYKVHDEKGEFHPGDVVTIEETHPISRDKRWRVVSKIMKQITNDK